MKMNVTSPSSTSLSMSMSMASSSLSPYREFSPGLLLPEAEAETQKAENKILRQKLQSKTEALVMSHSNIHLFLYGGVLKCRISNLSTRLVNLGSRAKDPSQKSNIVKIGSFWRPLAVKKTGQQTQLV